MLTNTDRVLLKTNAEPRREGTLDDQVLWSNLKTGNELAFSILYKRYVNRLYNYGMHSCKNGEVVKDCLQELFIRLWSRRETLGDAGSVNYYLFISFRRLLIKRLIANRKFSNPFKNQPVSIFEFSPPIEEFIIEEESKRQQLETLKSSINALSKRQREAIFLRYFNELSYHEVSSIMELRVESIYNLTSKAIDLLRAKLKGVAIFLIVFNLLQ